MNNRDLEALLRVPGSLELVRKFLAHLLDQVRDERVRELIELATEEGLQLPRPPEEIADLEAAGHVVDLVTGAIVWDGGSILAAPTTAGEAAELITALDAWLAKGAAV